ncbi:MAG TPA: PIN domain-containing protein [Thermoplasmata archaeon]|nr:PIN domain-containing protein [Thermoplasmata archaeon]
MENLFVDTTFWVARFNTRDANHDAALAFLERLRSGQEGNFRLITTDYVFDETVTAVLTRAKAHEAALEAGRAILASEAVRLEHVTPSEFTGAWDLFQKRGDKRWSFTDCASFCLMDRLGLRKALAFDENFAQAGFATLP